MALDPLLDMGALDFWGALVPEIPTLVESGAKIDNMRSRNWSWNVENGFDNPTFVADGTEASHQFLDNFNGPSPPTTRTVEHYPVGAYPVGGSAQFSDKYMHILDPFDSSGKPVLYTMFKANPTDGSPITSASHSYKCLDVLKPGSFPVNTSSQPVTSTAYGGNYEAGYNGYGNGPRSGGVDAGFGLISEGHFVRGYIGHALVCAAANGVLSDDPPYHIPPATMHDNDFATAFTGTVPLGTRLTLERDFDIDASLTAAPSKIIAQAMMDHGVYIMDRGGGGLTLYGDGSDGLLARIIEVNATSDYATLMAATIICDDRVLILPDGEPPPDPQNPPDPFDPPFTPLDPKDRLVRGVTT